MRVLKDEQNFNEFVNTFEWFIAELNNSSLKKV